MSAERPPVAVASDALARARDIAKKTGKSLAWAVRVAEREADRERGRLE